MYRLRAQRTLSPHEWYAEIFLIELKWHCYSWHADIHHRRCFLITINKRNRAVESVVAADVDTRTLQIRIE